MKIKTMASVQAEVEVEVDICDVIDELINRVDEADAGRWRVFITPADTLSKLVDSMDDQTITEMPCGVREAVHRRFSEMAERFKSHTQTQERK